MSMEMSSASGNLINTWAWDDTTDMGGAHNLFSLFHVIGLKSEVADIVCPSKKCKKLVMTMKYRGERKF